MKNANVRKNQDENFTQKYILANLYCHIFFFFKKKKIIIRNNFISLLKMEYIIC